MTARLKLSIAVSTWNRAGMLGSCLRSLREQVVTVDGFPGDVEILVIDDGSTDDTAGVARDVASEPGPLVRYLPQKHEGLSAARNRAVAQALGETILFFDDDQLAPEGYLQRLLDRLAAEAEAAGVGGPCRDYVGGPRTCSGCSLAAVDLPGEGLRTVDRLLGGNMAIRRETFDRVGPFDARISGRGDETEWFHRARGERFVQDPDLWIWHRRDSVPLSRMLADALRQGRATPLAMARLGRDTRPRPARMLRYLGHAARHRCAMGLVVACREIGWILGSRRVKPESVGTRSESR